MVAWLGRLAGSQGCQTHSLLYLLGYPSVRDRAPGPFYDIGQTHVNGWSRVVASQNGGSTSYIFPLRLGLLQRSRHLFNYWKNKKTIIEKEFLILLI